MNCSQEGGAGTRVVPLNSTLNASRGVLRRGASRIAQRGLLIPAVLLLLFVSGVGWALAHREIQQPVAWPDAVQRNAMTEVLNAVQGSAIMEAPNNAPGAMPCPDTNNNGQLDMNVDFLGGHCTQRLGRVPYRQLGLSEPRNHGSECLWYAVANGLENTVWPASRLPNAMPPQINPASLESVKDQLITIHVGNRPEINSVLAVVIGPGAPLPGQQRTTIGNGLCPGNFDPTQYFEVIRIQAADGVELSVNNATGIATETGSSVNRPGMHFAIPHPNTSANDRIAWITMEDLMRRLAPFVIRSSMAEVQGYICDKGIPALASADVGGEEDPEKNPTSVFLPWAEMSSDFKWFGENGWSQFMTYEVIDPSVPAITLTLNLPNIPQLVLTLSEWHSIHGSECHHGSP